MLLVLANHNLITVVQHDMFLDEHSVDGLNTQQMCLQELSRGPQIWEDNSSTCYVAMAGLLTN